VASLVFPPGLPAGRSARRQKKWRTQACRILLREWSRQHYADGVNKEQAFWYEHQVLDYGLLAGLLGECFGHPFPHRFWQQLELGLLHLAAMRDAGGQLPLIGDNDDGLAIDLGQSGSTAYASLLATGARLFENPLLMQEKQASGEPDVKTLFLLALQPDAAQVKHLDQTQPEQAQPGPARALPVAFEQGGYYVLGIHFRTPQEQKLIFDCGPLGYLTLAAHGHADALAFVFSAFGEQVFIDPGSYAYHTDPHWRTYFRSTLAHNTLRVAGAEQSMMAGAFMWSTHARARLDSYTPYLQVKGFHDGYRRLPQRVTHSREIRFRPDSGVWELTDQVLGKGRYRVQLAFHCAPACMVTSDLSGCRIEFNKGFCLLKPPPGLAVTLHRGEETPPLGWYAPAYLQKIPATTILLEGWVKDTATLSTRFRVTAYSA
jgi:hypothetical protein